MGRFSGKTAVVVGGGSGMGAASAARFAAEGARVAVLDIDASGAAKTASAIEGDGGVAFAEVCDVSKPDDVNRAIGAVVERYGRIDALLNCAGIFDYADFLEAELENWKRVIDVDLTGTFLVTQAVAKNMAENGGGAIVCIASVDAHAGEACSASYDAAKRGMLGLVQSAAIDLAKHGIRINSISPGYTETPMVLSYLTPSQLEHMRGNFDRVPLRRMVLPKEIAAAALFLCSDDASAITGTDLIVDCGTMANCYLNETLPYEEGSEFEGHSLPGDKA